MKITCKLTAAFVGVAFLSAAVCAVLAAGTVWAQTWEERNADQSFVALIEEHRTVLRDDWSYEVTDRMVVKIQKEDAKELGEIPVEYDRSREEIAEVTAFVTTPDGQRLPYTKLQEMAVYDDMPMYSDVMRKIITLPQVTVGCVIEWQVRRVVKGEPIPGRFWAFVSLPSVPTKAFRDIFVFPADKRIDFRSYKDPLAPRVDRTPKSVMYTFEEQETDEGENEEYMPPPYEITGFSMFSSVPDWAVIADWYRGLVAKNTVPDKAIDAAVAKLTDGKTTQADKVRAICEYLQDNFRYVSMSLGAHALEPHPTPEVFANRYGDCKDQCVLARQMLARAGIPSSIALFCTEESGSPKNGLPALDYFDHVMLEATVDGQRQYLDPLMKGYDIGQYHYGYEGGTLFVITDDGYRFETMPVRDERSHYERKDVVETIQPDGSVVREVRSQWDLEFSLETRESWQASSEKEREEFYQSLDEIYTKGGTVAERSWEGMDARYGPIRSYLKFTAPREYPVINDMILINAGGEERGEEFTKKERVYPIYFPVNSLNESTTTYHIPPGYRVDFVPEGFSLRLPFIETAKTFAASGDTVTVSGYTRTRRATVEPDRYREVKDYFNAVAQNKNQYIVLKKIPAGGAAK